MELIPVIISSHCTISYIIIILISFILWSGKESAMTIARLGAILLCSMILSTAIYSQISITSQDAGSFYAAGTALK